MNQINAKELRAIRAEDVPEAYQDIVEALGLEVFLTLTDLCGDSTCTSPSGKAWSGRAGTGRSGPGSTGGTPGPWQPSSASASGRSARSSAAPAHKHQGSLSGRAGALQRANKKTARTGLT